MQFHLNGFRSSDPALDAEALVESPPAHEVDVLIVGCGPAGLTLATQLAAFPSIHTRIIDQKPGPLELGQADGLACRTLEMFEAFGFSDRVLKEGYWVNETAFWVPGGRGSGGIARSRTIQDVEDGLSEFPHIILNQARVHTFLLDAMRNSPSRLQPDYCRRLIDLRIADGRSGTVVATLERQDEGHVGQIETVCARYVVGCDGARSAVRRFLQRPLRGDSANQAWGVMDVLAVSNFPDIRRKALIQSGTGGSAVLIPREGGYLTRWYVELDQLKIDRRIARQQVTVEQLIASARRILDPYMLDVKHVVWWSVYEIGQRLCDRFDDVAENEDGKRIPRVFIAGDACHTHSPKAGQGMNVSMQDAFNLGWKLAAVIRGFCTEQLLLSYSEERQAVARELIDFDRKLTRLLGARPRSDTLTGLKADPFEEYQEYFIKHGRYTAGVATQYAPSLIVGESTHQSLATGFAIGMRFHSAPVIRRADAKQVQLGHVARADGRWRLFAFADRNGAKVGSALWALCEFLEKSPKSPVRRYNLSGMDVDEWLEVLAVFQNSHREIELKGLPALLLPRKGRFGLIDYEKMYCPDRKLGDVFDLRGIDRDRGCIVVVRPDQCVATILPLDAHRELAEFFDRFMLEFDAPKRPLAPVTRVPLAS